MSRTPAFAGLLALLLLSGCCMPRLSGPIPQVIQRPPVEVTQEAQEMAALAFVSYLGELVEGTDHEVERTLVPCAQREIGRQPLLKDRWSLVWGPAVHRFSEAELDDNMMFVAQSTVEPERLVVAVRGTNAKAILDWVVEDFEVLRTVAWNWQQGSPDLHPRISHGTSNGLEVLRDMRPVAGLGSGKRLHEFLGDQVKNNGVRSIAVVGHSLGGALAPALGLWLEDTRKGWDPGDLATVGVWGFAGPSPGNADFASYYDTRLGGTSHRVHNPFDVVPHAWQKDQMARIPGLYRPAIKPPFGVRTAVCLAIDLTEGHHYQQQLENAPPIAGHVFDGVPGYVEQLACQHTCGYYRGLELVVWDPESQEYIQHLKPITVDCVHFSPEPRCDLCPGWGGDS